MSDPARSFNDAGGSERQMCWPAPESCAGGTSCPRRLPCPARCRRTAFAGCCVRYGDGTLLVWPLFGHGSRGPALKLRRSLLIRMPAFGHLIRRAASRVPRWSTNSPKLATSPPVYSRSLGVAALNAQNRPAWRRSRGGNPSQTWVVASRMRLEGSSWHRARGAMRRCPGVTRSGGGGLEVGAERCGSLPPCLGEANRG